MKREVALVIGAVLIVLVIIGLYYWSGGPTGFAVLEQGTEADFNEGIYENLTHNTSAIVLNSNQTVGAYTSKIFDAGEAVLWNNLTWTGNAPQISIINLVSATLNGSNVISELSSKDDVFLFADMPNSKKLQLNFSKKLKGYTLKIYARKNKSEAVGIYAGDDLSGTTPLGIFNVTSTTGEWVNISLNLQSQKDSIWLGKGSGSGQNPTEEFDYIYAEKNIETNISFQVRVCFDANCSDANFTSADLNNLNLQGRYFQYKIQFTTADSENTPVIESVSIEYTPPILTSITISEPSRTKFSQSGIPIQFSIIGENLNCWYSVEDAEDSAVIIQNTTIEGCNNNTSFNLGAGDGDYVFRLYADGTSGFASKSSSFSVSTASDEDEEESEEETSTEEPTEEPPVQVPVIPQEPLKITELTASDISASPLITGDSKEIKWTVQNTGTEPISDCVFKASGDFASWMSGPEESNNFNQGESKELVLNIEIPEETQEGNYLLSVSIDCQETSVAKDFSADVVKKKLELEIISAQRTKKDRVRVIYSLGELSGEDQNVEIQFSLLDLNSQKVGETNENKSLDANSSKEFKTNININESLLPVNATTNETLESELTLNINLNSQIFSSSIQEPVTLGAPVGGLAILDEGALDTGGIIILIVFVLALIAVFLVVRIKKSGKSLKSAFKIKSKD